MAATRFTWTYHWLNLNHKHTNDLEIREIRHFWGSWFANSKVLKELYQNTPMMRNQQDYWHCKSPDSNIHSLAARSNERLLKISSRHICTQHWRLRMAALGIRKPVAVYHSHILTQNLSTFIWNHLDCQNLQRTMSWFLLPRTKSHMNQEDFWRT